MIECMGYSIQQERGDVKEGYRRGVRKELVSTGRDRIQ